MYIFYVIVKVNVLYIVVKVNVLFSQQGKGKPARTSVHPMLFAFPDFFAPVTDGSTGSLGFG